MEKLSLTICAVVCLLLAACSNAPTTIPAEPANGTLPPIDSAPDEAVLPATGLPAFPVLDMPEPRMTSVTSTRTLAATDVWQRPDVGTAIIGDAMAFSNLAKPGWAIYKFGGLYDTDQPQLFSFRLENDEAWLPQHLYIGISNFATQSWNWYEAHYPAADFSFAIPPADIPEPSPGGNLYVCLLTMSEGFMLHSLSMSFDYVAPPPVDLRASDGAYQTGIELTWADPDVTYEGGQPFDYDGIVIERATSQAGPWDEIATVATGITTYTDAEAPALGPVKLYYRLHLVNAGNAGHLGLPDQGYVDFAPVVLPITGQTQNVPAPYSVELSVLGSYDPDGGALKYEWRFENGPWESTDILPQMSHTFMHNANVNLRATDDEGTVTSFNYYQAIAGTAVSLAAKYANGDTYGFRYGFVDGQQNVVMAAGFSSDNALCKLDSDLHPLWVRGWQGLHPESCCTDGSFYASDGQKKVARFTADGDLLWAKQIGNVSQAWGLDSCWTDPASNLWVLGMDYSLPYSNAEKIIVAAINASGELIFCKSIAGPTEPEYAHATGIAFDDVGNAIIRAGRITDTRKSYVIRLDPTGNLIWQKSIQDEAGNYLPYWGAMARVGDSYICAADDVYVGYLFAIDSDGIIQCAKSTPDRYFTSLRFFSDGANLNFCSEYSPYLGRVYLPSWSLYTWQISAIGGYWGLGPTGGRNLLYFDGSAGTGNWTDGSYYLQTVQLVAVDENDFSATDVDATLTDFSLVEEPYVPEIVEEPNHIIFCNFTYAAVP